ncbi:MAG: hypothetical protein JRN15_20135 [Nitrososphaerota archaeon]|nr:hypothetical protein [Nitrososphaerota archaeon]
MDELLLDSSLSVQKKKNGPAAVKTYTPEFYFGAALTILGLIFAALSFLARGK